jgi:hypothetical protein
MIAPGNPGSREERMSEWETQGQGGATEAPDDDEQGGMDDDDTGTDDDGNGGWDETNDEPAQGEGGQESV